ncbi:MAG: transposase family protein, partial [Candidatus Limnocylindria bacterium]
MRKPTLWRGVFGVEHSVIEDVRFDEEEGVLIASVRPKRRERGRCGICRRKCPRYDAGHGRRRWRTLDLGSLVAYMEAQAPRVECPEHGVTVAAVPWARHEARHSRAFDDQAAWLA